MLTQSRILLLFTTILLLCNGAFAQTQDPDKDVPQESGLSTQLKINRDALLTGSSEIRVDAASQLLVDQDPLARIILLEILNGDQNNQARLAICQAICKTRSYDYEISDKQDFIEPLINILTKQQGQLASQASEAFLAFEYDQIADKLESKASNASLPIQARLNIIHALKLQPDIRAIYKLLELVDDQNNEVSKTAAQTLTVLGITAGADSTERMKVKKELKRKGKNAFLLDRIRWLDNRNRNLEAQRAFWRQKFIQASERIYKEISNDEIRGKYLAAEFLNSQDQFLKMWGLTKVEEWLKGTNSQVPDYIGELLLKLIAENSKDIRIKAAQLLPWFMGELNSAQPLVEQIKVESDNDARLELFIALGSACRYASLPNSTVKISDQIKKQTLDWAVDYLSCKDMKEVKSGSEVIKKMLEQNGLTEMETRTYLQALEERYKVENVEANPEIRAYLLNVMASICNRQAYHAQAVSLFMNFFAKALEDEVDIVREAAMEGWICIDEKRAFHQLKKDFINDSSLTIRKKLIDLAGQIGGENDLEWLVQKLNSPQEYQAAWAAMIKILNDSNAQKVVKCLNDIEQLDKTVDAESYLTLLKIAEQKTAAEKKPELLDQVRYKIAGFYGNNGKFEESAKYLATLIKSSENEKQQQYTADLLDIYLRGGNYNAAGNLISNQLLDNDMLPESYMALSLENHLADANSVSDPNSVIAALTDVTKDISERPNWQKLLRKWKERFCTSATVDPNAMR